MKRMVSVASMALLLSVQVARADVIPGSVTDVAGWRVGAYDDKKGSFSHCAMSSAYRSGITMLFSVSGDFSWRVGWTHPSWRFTKGQSVELVLFVDDVGPFNLRADAVTEKLALAELPAKATVFDLMRKGNRMSVRALGNTYAFRLDGTYAALTEILACARRHAAVAGSGPAPGSRATPPPAPMMPRTAQTPPQQSDGVTAEQRLEATKVVANILAQGDMTNFRILSAKEIAELDNAYISQSHVAWKADGIVGTLRILPGGRKISLSSMNSAILSDDAKHCKGKFASGSTPDEKSPSVLRLFTACEEGGKVYEFRYTVVPAGDGTSYLFATAGTADRESGDRIAKVEAALRQAVYEVLKQ
jgi:hypothetical protein